MRSERLKGCGLDPHSLQLLAVIITILLCLSPLGTIPFLLLQNVEQRRKRGSDRSTGANETYQLDLGPRSTLQLIEPSADGGALQEHQITPQGAP